MSFINIKVASRRAKVRRSAVPDHVFEPKQNPIHGTIHLVLHQFRDNLHSFFVSVVKRRVSCRFSSGTKGGGKGLTWDWRWFRRWRRKGSRRSAFSSRDIWRIRLFQPWARSAAGRRTLGILWAALRCRRLPDCWTDRRGSSIGELWGEPECPCTAEATWRVEYWMPDWVFHFHLRTSTGRAAAGGRRLGRRCHVSRSADLCPWESIQNWARWIQPHLSR